MAQVLVFARNNIHSDPIKDRTGSYKKGYPVVAKEDSWTWGALEVAPDFYIVKLPKIPVADVLKYTVSEIKDGIIYRRRQWRIKIETLPIDKQTLLETKGELIVKATPTYLDKSDMDWKDMKTYFLDQASGLTETNDL